MRRILVFRCIWKFNVQIVGKMHQIRHGYTFTIVVNTTIKKPHLFYNSYALHPKVFFWILGGNFPEDSFTKGILTLTFPEVPFPQKPQ